jgi:patatin-related protein
MKEKELRLAVVFFGGVSLAVYEHGINREILNLVRASKLYHGTEKGTDSAPAAPRFQSFYPDEPERSTGEVYLQFLERVGQHLALRVIVDVISGASAGGINAIALARALAHDLSLAPLTDIWLTEADMLKLLAPEARAKAWSKWYFWPFIRPMISILDREGLLFGKVDAEMQNRLSVFLRSRWFKPPLDGSHLTALVFDGLEAMEGPNASTETLLPAGTKLDLLVTATDFRGLDRSIFIHDPPMVQEREHRHIFRFSLEHHKTGHVQSDFDFESVPALTFAARASASYPGAFPPAQLPEIDDFLAARRRLWPARSRFLARNFSRYRDQGKRPEEAVLVDGSILDNKPIMATLETIRAHSAFREVDRRLIYIDPHSRTDRPDAPMNVPGFFSTLRGALSDLPRNDPIYNELAEVRRYNKQTRRLRETIIDARSHVTELIERATGGKFSGSYSINDLRHWRLGSSNQLAVAPIVYDPWIRSLVLEAVDFVADLISSACGFSKDSAHAQWVQETVEQWARNHAAIISSYPTPIDAHDNSELPAYGRMVVDFAVVYKRRRLNFVLNEINELYEDDASHEICPTEPENLDLIKLKIHKLIDEMSMYDNADFLSKDAIAACRKLFPTDRAEKDINSYAIANDAALSHLITRLGIECDLARSNDDADAVLSSELVVNLDSRCRSAILTGYLGYFYWDILLRPVATALSLEAGPIAEILIDRISPDDAVSLKSAYSRHVLLGGSFASFGGFLSRAARENDYLWGRLHGVERLFDILASTVPASAHAALDIPQFKKMAFETVMNEESRRLSLDPELIARINKAIAAL